MTSIPVTAVEAWEVLDSRGRPTVRARVETDRCRGVFTVPSGASAGTHEAVEVRDGGDRYGGLGVETAVESVETELAPLVEGRDVTDQRAIDEALVECDGTANLSRVGANAVLAVSGAAAHAASASLDRPLYEYLAAEEPGRLPMPMVNLLSGGRHATGGIEIQDFLVVPLGSDSYTEALETVWRVRDAVRQRILAGGNRALLADEGGFAPPLASVEDAFELLATGVRDAGHDPARDDVAFAVDVAATHFHDTDRDRYDLDSFGRSLTTEEMVEIIAGWVADWPVVSVEDPLAEDDWTGWRDLVRRVGDEVQVLGDDLLVTSEARLETAAETGAANAVLVKPNQVGTLTGAIDVAVAGNDAEFGTVVSARSGETCDTTIADLAVALDAGQIKIGSLARSERLAKYNRLLAIDRRRGLPFGVPESLSV